MSKNDLFAKFREQYALEDQEQGGPQFWRSLEHKEGTDESREFAAREFRSDDASSSAGVQRRDVLKLMGASFALAGMTGCVRRPEEEILPYTKQPEHLVPGIPMFFATTMPRPDGALGLVVETHEGRPTKIEGNPDHPASQGRADVWAQASVLQLYDPDRSRNPWNGGREVGWSDWDTFVQTLQQKLSGNGGAGLAFLTEHEDGPTWLRLVNAAKQRYPNARFYTWDPLQGDAASVGAETAFGPGVNVRYDLDKADVILSVDSDFLANGPDHVRLARAFGLRRHIKGREDAAGMNRLYVVEGAFTTTGTNADHRMRVPSSQCGMFLKALAAELTKQGAQLPSEIGGQLQTAFVAGDDRFIPAVAKDLLSKRGRAVVVVGERQPPAVHALGHAINAALGATEGGPVALTARRDLSGRGQASDGEGAAATAQPAQTGIAQLTALVDALGKGQVETLVILGSNPVYTAPGALGFAEAMKKAQTTIHAGMYRDETGTLATWHLPSSHYLESWGDARAVDGTASIVQPMVLPLFATRTLGELLAQLSGAQAPKAQQLVQETWRQNGVLASDAAWRKALHDGVIPGTADEAGGGQGSSGGRQVRGAEVAQALAAVKDVAVDQNNLEIVFTTTHVLDGRLANIGWTQELPHNVSKICWDNALYVSVALAKALGIKSKIVGGKYYADVVKVTVDGRTIEAPVYVLPGVAPHTVAIDRGYGRWAAGAVADGVGVDVHPLMPVNGQLFANGAKLEKTGKTIIVCTAQDHFTVEGRPFQELTTLTMGNRPLHRSGSLKLYEEKGDAWVHVGDIPSNLIPKGSHMPGNGPRPAEPIQLWDGFEYDGQQWGMAIDLTACIGCSACTIACQSENIIPVVGREQVLMNREMHWIRVDRYFKGDVDNPTAAHQPVPCMQCENAPCEAVCPVAATVHSPDGLNDMAYNRCIGTRYCSNNCPYKVRRFNYLDFTRTGNVYVDPVERERYRLLKMQRNPDVTVRYRGVMEKCTYCTQRIEQAKYAAKRRNEDPRWLPDGAVVPACAQTCPTDAITFGNINNPDSRVAQAKKVDRNYEMLNELNTRPRTTYLARLKNLNPELTERT